MEASLLSDKSKEELIALILEQEAELPKAQARIKQLEFQVQECKSSQIEQVNCWVVALTISAKVGRSRRRVHNKHTVEAVGEIESREE